MASNEQETPTANIPTLQLKTPTRSDVDFLQRRIQTAQPSDRRYSASPERSHISGYAGFVPRYREYVGASFPEVTGSALRDFDEEQARLSSRRGRTPRTVDLSQTPNLMEKEEKKKVQNFPIFPQEAGLIPNYSGHIPGEQFRFGGTFGKTTMSAGSSYKRKS